LLKGEGSLLNKKILSRHSYGVIPSIKSNEKFVVVVHRDIFKDEIIALLVDKFHLEKQILIIDLPLLKEKNLDSSIIRLKPKHFKRQLFFGGKPAYIDEKVYGFLVREALFNQVVLLQNVLQHHDSTFINDELTITTMNRFNLDVMNFVNFMMNKLSKDIKPIYQLKIFIHGIYSVMLFGGLGSEQIGILDVVIWKQYINKDDPSKSTYFAYPLHNNKPEEGIIHQYFSINVNNRTRYVDISNGKRISHMRISHPVYNYQTKQITYVLDKNTVNQLSDAIVKYYSKTN
jgi:hypothetical protein